MDSGLSATDKVGRSESIERLHFGFCLFTGIIIIDNYKNIE